ncbi:MarR family transcriptional regulator [Tenacibaculum caenipelagi]|uniref:DNA-binding MarR family transcriptional regulator n=1 Tax=Tenacibaculum caenipelagi TaxID=1325435 RepID=A0A4R6TE00_9FLAO|nr:MarR family transcriptional regulator [Tenacibaculum caenipelagi]TDQ23890.1 DNA-binding MarR family transcriptional regulator [Tenacibaculum caenipelagi]
MNNDLVREMGYIALATRLKRISDKMTHSTRLMYRNLNIDIEPNWYLVLIIVQQNPNISVMEIAESLGFTHQSVITMTNKMIKKEYLQASKDEKDKRKTVFNLNQKAIEILPKIEQIWGYGKEVIYELLNEDISIIEHLEVLESNLEKASFGERILEKNN